MGTVHALSDLETLEVSLVPRGANKKKRFPIMKKSTESNAMSDTLHAVLDAPSPEDERFEGITKEAGITEDAALAVKGAMKILSAYSDVISAENSVALVSKAFSVEVVKEDEEDEAKKDESKKDEEQKDEAQKDEEQEESQKEFPPASEDDEDEEDEDEDEEEPKEEEAKRTKTTVSIDVQKSNLPPEMKAEVQRLWKANKKLETVLKKERDERLTKDYIAKAQEEYPKVPGISSDELGILLKSLHVMDSAISAKLETVLKSTNDIIAKGSVFEEIGSNAVDSNSSSFSQLDTIAKDKVTKSAGNVSYSKAFDNALTENPALYNDYLNEREG